MARHGGLRNGRVMQAAMPLRALVHRSAFFFFLLLSGGLLLVSKTDPAFTPTVRGAVLDTLDPALRILSQPVQLVERGADAVDTFFATYGDNRRLREENGYLLYWQQTARQLEHENAALRRLLNMPPDMGQGVTMTVKILGDASGPYGRTLLVSGGARDGVNVRQVALAPEGVIGRVIDAGRRTGRILLLTDTNARLPVIVERTRARAILSGDNGPQPRLNYLPPNSVVEPGDRLLTSGDGGLYPANLPVGLVDSVNGSAVRVRLFANPEFLEYVRLMQIPDLDDAPAKAAAGAQAEGQSPRP